MAIPAAITALIESEYEETVGMSSAELKLFILKDWLKVTGLVERIVRSNDAVLIDARSNLALQETATQTATQAVHDAKAAIPAAVDTEIAKVT